MGQRCARLAISYNFVAVTFYVETQGLQTAELVTYTLFMMVLMTLLGLRQYKFRK